MLKLTIPKSKSNSMTNNTANNMTNHISNKQPLNRNLLSTVTTVCLAICMLLMSQLTIAMSPVPVSQLTPSSAANVGLTIETNTERAENNVKLNTTDQFQCDSYQLSLDVVATSTSLLNDNDLLISRAPIRMNQTYIVLTVHPKYLASSMLVLNCTSAATNASHIYEIALLEPEEACEQTDGKRNARRSPIASNRGQPSSKCNQ